VPILEALPVASVTGFQGLEIAETPGYISLNGSALVWGGSKTGDSVGNPVHPSVTEKIGTAGLVGGLATLQGALDVV
jgi:hypothetical protein